LIDTIGTEPSIIRLKLSCPFSVLAIYTLFTIAFFEEVWRFFVAMAKNGKNYEVNFITLVFID
jgi:hypothetical protein